MELCYIPNAVGGYFFSISPEGAYIHGPLYLAQHLVSLWFVLCASVTLIANHKRIKRDHVISGYLFIALYLVAIVLQTFVWSDVLIIMPVVSVMLLIAVFSLESPDYIQLQKTLQALSKTQQELETANEKLRNLAYIDLMTGLQNRTAYHLQIERLGATAGTEDVVVLMADINGLKALNDHLGHLVGDDAIKRTARLIRDAFDGRCSCYRIGGDEFAVIASDVTEAEFQECYARFLKAVSQDSERVSYSFSVASGYQRMGQKTLLDTQREADERMYADKERQKRAAQAYDGLPFVSGRRS
jgi:diguanylate cyclase (GGDEF)-like protein